MSSQEYPVWLWLNLMCDTPPKVNEHWWRTTLPFPPYLGLILTSLGDDCPVQRCCIAHVEYDRTARQFLCWAEVHECRDADEFNLVDSLLNETCRKKPF